MLRSGRKESLGIPSRACLRFSGSNIALIRLLSLSNSCATRVGALWNDHRLSVDTKPNNVFSLRWDPRQRSRVMISLGLDMPNK